MPRPSTSWVSCRPPRWAAQFSWASLLISFCMSVGCRGTPDEASSPPFEANAVVMSHPPTDLSSAAVDDAGALVSGDTKSARKLRHRLVLSIASFDKPWGGDGPWDERVLDVMRTVPRHLFMPGQGLMSAYRDAPAPIGHGQTISQPTVVALMTHALRLTGKERVLEIGTGSGYQAAVLSGLVADLYSIEIVAPLGEAAKKRLADLGYDNVHVRIGDGYAGWPDEAPFDRIILTAAPPEIPSALIDQLVDGGVIVGPVGDGDQVLVRWVKRGASVDKTVLGAVRFVPMVPAAPTGARETKDP